jgi:hypothetical protein
MNNVADKADRSVQPLVKALFPARLKVLFYNPLPK